MNEIIKIENVDGNLLVGSREVAANFNKEHRNIVRDIERLIEEDCSILSNGIFIVSSYKNSNNRIFKEYFMSRDGFSLLVMGFTGSKALEWKLKYINAFNKMEQSLREQSNPYGNLSKELQAIIALDMRQQEVDKKVENVVAEVIDLRENAPLYNVECDEISKRVRNVGVRILGGKKSEAYADKSLRAQVYTDIYQQLKRQFGVTSYKAIKRGQLHRAYEIIENYEAPIVLQDEIEMANRQLALA